MPNKDALVDWLCANEALVLEIVKKTTARLRPYDFLFHDEMKAQQYQEVKRDLVDEMTECMAIPEETIDALLDEKELQGYIQNVLDNSTIGE